MHVDAKSVGSYLGFYEDPEANSGVKKTQMRWQHMGTQVDAYSDQLRSDANSGVSQTQA